MCRSCGMVLLMLALGLAGSLSAQDVDPAMRKLAAANGLFQRQLYKLAAEEYAHFLTDHPAHPQATTARYALSICRFRLSEYASAITELNIVVRDRDFAQRDQALLVLGHCHLAQKDHARALAAFDELLAGHAASGSAETAWLNRAQVLYLLDRKREAAAACEAFLRNYPDSGKRPEAMYFWALALGAIGEHARAIGTLDDLNRVYPGSRHELDSYLLKGQCLEAQGKLDQAAEQYRLFLKSAPVNRQAEGQFALGVALYKAGQYEPAEAAMNVILSQHGGSAQAAPARLQLGLTQWAARKIDAARQALDQVVKSDPARAPVARYWLAQCDIVENRHESARAILDELARLQPPPVDPAQLDLDRADCLLGMKKYGEGAGEYEAWQKRYPQNSRLSEAMHRQAFCLHKINKAEQSLAIAQRIKWPAGHAMARPTQELIAENLFLLHRYNDAQAVYRELVKNAPNPEAKLRAELRVGQCAYFAGDYDHAIDVLRPLAANKLLTADPDMSRAILLFGDALLQRGRYRESADVLARYVPLAKDDKLEAIFKLGLAQLRGGDAAAAEKNFTEAMGGTEESIWVQRSRFEFAQLKYKQGQHAKAAEALEKAAAGSLPEDLAAPVTYLRAWIDMDSRRPAEAAEHFGRVVERYPRHALAPESMFHRAVALKEAGRSPEAVAAFQAYLGAHAAGPYALKARQLMAATMVKLEQHAEAIRTLTALAADPKSVTDEVLYDLAWSQQATRDSASAQKTYRRLIEQYPSSRLVPAARVELAELLYQQEEFAAAAKVLEEVVDDRSADPKTVSVAVYRLGSCYEKLNDPARAAAMFRSFLARKGDEELVAWAHYQAGVNFVRQEKFDEAMKHFQSALDSRPRAELAALATLKLGEVQAQAGQFEASEKTFRGFLAKFEKDRFAYQAHFGLGWALENQRKYDDARGAYQQVIATHNGATAARAQFQVGETHFAEGQYEKAVAALLAVVDVYAYPEWSARALLEAGRAFEQLKQPEQAAAQYRMLVNKHRDRPEAELAAKRLKSMEKGQ